MTIIKIVNCFRCQKVLIQIGPADNKFSDRNIYISVESNTEPQKVLRLYLSDMKVWWCAICSYCVSRLDRHVTYYSSHMLYICRYPP